MTPKRVGAVTEGGLDASKVVDLARRTAEPAVTILMDVAQPAAMHPETALRLRALVERALDITESWWGAEAAEGVRAQLERPELQLDPLHEAAHGLAILVTPDDGQLLRLAFPVEEEVVVDRTFATRQLFEGVARNPRYRVLVLDGHRAHLFEGQGGRLAEASSHGFPLHVEPPHEQDTPHRDLPIHDEVEKEEHRIVYRSVDEALGSACRADPLPTVVAAAERELTYFEEVTIHGEQLVGRLRGNYAHASPTELAAAVQPILEAQRATEQARVVERLREAHGRERAVFGLHAVKEAAEAGRGHLLVVEEGYTFPGHWVDGLAPGETPDEQLDIDDVVDDVIETVALAGGQIVFVDDGALADSGHMGLLLRY
jgi:hypothetical protein